MKSSLRSEKMTVCTLLCDWQSSHRGSSTRRVVAD